jgi:hypothetical protein
MASLRSAGIALCLMASLRSAGIAPRRVGVEDAKTDHGKERLVCFGVLDTDGRDPTRVRSG